MSRALPFSRPFRRGPRGRLRTAAIAIAFAAGLALGSQIDRLPLIMISAPPELTGLTDQVRQILPRLDGVRVIDGDTIAMGSERIRIANIDTPEKGSLARCAEERRRAARATAHARRLFAQAEDIDVYRQGRDHYGRTIARVRLDGWDFGSSMISAGHARRWTGRREPWCH